MVSKIVFKVQGNDKTHFNIAVTAGGGREWDVGDHPGSFGGGNYKSGRWITNICLIIIIVNGLHVCNIFLYASHCIHNIKKK